MLSLSSRQKALLALVLLVPVSSFGEWIVLMVAPGPIGQTVQTIAKVWMLLLPLVWLRWVTREPIAWPPLTRRGLKPGIVLGVLMAVVIVGAYWGIAQPMINVMEIRAKVQQAGNLSLGVFAIGVVFWSLINSLLEEYVWRWFVFRNCEVLTGATSLWGGFASGAAVLSAVFFTLHHIIDLAAYFPGNGLVIGLGSLAVFSAGLIWSVCYQRYRSIWSCYVSHIIADLALALVSWHVLFA